jgi:hypothetical protein
MVARKYTMFIILAPTHDVLHVDYFSYLLVRLHNLFYRITVKWGYIYNVVIYIFLSMEHSSQLLCIKLHNVMDIPYRWKCTSFV